MSSLAFHGDTITDLMHDTVRQHLDCPQPDAVLNIETHLFNTCLVADSCEYELDIGKQLWLNRSRWSRLTREYVPLDPWERFRDQAREILDGQARDGATANMLFRDPDRYDKKHRWGGCLMGATFRGDNRKAGPATITFYSRTTYMGYMGLMDAAIACCMAANIWDNGARTGVAQIGFRWYISSQQLHCFKTLPYIYSQPDLMLKLERLAKSTRAKPPSPTWLHLSKWYKKVLEHWDNSGNDVEKFLSSEKYGPFRRIKRRWCEHMGFSKKLLPKSLFPYDLDFTKCE